MKIRELLENENIKADRFGMAAISYIFKAFGDNERSQYYWPFSEKLGLGWYETLEGDEANISDLTMAVRMINEATKRYNIENSSENKIIVDNKEKNISDFKRKLNKIKLMFKLNNKSTNSVNNILRQTERKINSMNS